MLHRLSFWGRLPTLPQQKGNGPGSPVLRPQKTGPLETSDPDKNGFTILEGEDKKR